MELEDVQRRIVEDGVLLKFLRYRQSSPGGVRVPSY